MKPTYSVVFLAALTLVLGCTDASVSPTNTSTSTSDNDATPSETQADTASAAETEASAVDTAEAEAPKKHPFLPDGALTIGSKAPALEIEHWLSNGKGAFSEVTEFEPGKVYVVEFWATWCDPCVASMPHLSLLQTKYKDKVQIVSVTDQELDVVKEFLDRPFTSGGEKGPQTYRELTSYYCLTVDPDQSVAKSYMLASGQAGIPACFVVGKTGLIEWVGHPGELGDRLEDILGGTWDREKFAKTFQTEQMYGLMRGRVFEAAEANDFEAAAKFLEQARRYASPRDAREVAMIELKLKMLPVEMLLQERKFEEAVEELKKRIDASEGPMKKQLASILEQLEEAIGNLADEEAAAEPTETVEPAE